MYVFFIDNDALYIFLIQCFGNFGKTGGTVSQY